MDPSWYTHLDSYGLGDTDSKAVDPRAITVHRFTSCTCSVVFCRALELFYLEGSDIGEYLALNTSTSIPVEVEVSVLRLYFDAISGSP